METIAVRMIDEVKSFAFIGERETMRDKPHHSRLKSLFLLGIIDPFFLLAGLITDGTARLAGGLTAGTALAATHNVGLSLGFCYGADMLHILLLGDRADQSRSFHIEIIP